MIRGRRRVAAVLRIGARVLVVAALMCLHGVTRGAAAAPVLVGVVDFYAPGPEAIINAVVPSRASAEELTRLLADAGGAAGLGVVPRAIMERSESGMRWGSQDALSFARLGALARAAGANRLVVGWLPIVGAAGGGTQPPQGSKDGNGTALITADVVVQIFDADQGRIVAETRSSGSAISGPVAALGTLQMLRSALLPTVPWLIAHLSQTSVGAARVPNACCQ